MSRPESSWRSPPRFSWTLSPAVAGSSAGPPPRSCGLQPPEGRERSRSRPARRRAPQANGDPAGGVRPPTTSDPAARRRAPSQHRLGGRLRALAGPSRPPRPGVQRDRLRGHPHLNLQTVGSREVKTDTTSRASSQRRFPPSWPCLPTRPTYSLTCDLPASIALAVASAL